MNDDGNIENNSRFSGAGESFTKAFVLDIDGFEGPIDVLLKLARDQKVDLIHVSILQLAEQYLEFVTEARKYNLELAADYLVMAAWLAYLKSRLLLPDISSDDEPSGEEMAKALAFRLRRLEAMRDAGSKLFLRKQLNADFFSRGQPESFSPNYIENLDVNLFSLLSAYSTQVRRKNSRLALNIKPFSTYTLEEASTRLKEFLKVGVDWQNLWQYLPENIVDNLFGRSAIATTLLASLEMVKQGKIVLKQKVLFGPILLGSKRKESDGADGKNIY